jgi:cytochrome P450
VSTRLAVQTLCTDIKNQVRFRTWANEYGGVYSLKFGPKSVIVLCDRKAVHELVDKKGVLYSDRPHTYVGNLMTQGDHMVISSLDPVTREKRKVLTHNFSVRP